LFARTFEAAIPEVKVGHAVPASIQAIGFSVLAARSSKFGRFGMVSGFRTPS